MIQLNYIKLFQQCILLPFFLIIFYCYPLLSYELLVQSDDAIISKDADELKSVITKKGYVKFIYNKNKYDLFTNTNIAFSKESMKLDSGDLRIIVENFENLKIITPVGVVSIVNNGDYLIQYNLEKADLSVVVFEGSALIQGHYREEILNLQMDEKGGFTGFNEAEGPAFDVLLKGRKSVRGSLNGPFKLNQDQKKSLLSQYSIILKPKIANNNNTIKAKPGEICRQPFAKFNDCVWRCVGEKNTDRSCDIKNNNVSCIRERCLANGQWGDKIVLHGDAKANCESKKIKIAPCLY